MTYFLMYSFSNKREIKLLVDLSLCVRKACSNSSSFYDISCVILPFIGLNYFPGTKPTNSLTRSRADFCVFCCLSVAGETPLARSCYFKTLLILFVVLVYFRSKFILFSKIRLDRCPFNLSGWPS